jgi:phosphatidate cytidylyltransferase
MTRLASALALLPPVVLVIWALPPVATLVLAEVVLTLALVEYLALVADAGAKPPAVLTGAVAMSLCAAVGWPGVPLAPLLLAALVGLGAWLLGAGTRMLVARAGAVAFAGLYLGLPLGAVAALRASHGPEVVLLLLATVMASDTAQYYGGRWLGRRPLAPAISPRKTVEGCLAGFVAGLATMAVLGGWGLPSSPPLARGLLGATLVLSGVVGDLFESALKRSAGVKDASGLIPGHGGMLDRIDSLLFAAPIYYLYVLYVAPGRS